MRIFVAVGVLAWAVASGSVARADDAKPPSKEAVEEAGKHFKRGVELFKESDFGGALAEFRRTQQIAPNFHILYNLGQTYFELQNYPEALRAFEGYLSEGGNKLPKDRRAAVEADIAKLRSRVALVDIVVDVEGSDVTIDGEPAGTSPLKEAVLVSAGRRRITASHAGRVPVTKTIEVVGAERTSVTLELPEVPKNEVLVAAPAATPTPAADDGAERARQAAEADAASARTAMWIGWGVTGALGLATITTGALSLSANSDLNKQLERVPGDPKAIDDARSKAKTFATTTDVLLVSTLVGAGVATYLTVRAVNAGHKEEPATAARLDFTVGPLSLLASGTF